MPWEIAKKIELSDKQEQLLKEYAVGTHTPLHFKIRSQIILQAAQGLSNYAIKNNMSLDIRTVQRWRARYCMQQEKLNRAEIEMPRKMRSKVEEILSDEQRPGAPPTFTDEQIAAIIALACEEPVKRNLPFSHWTPGLLQIEVIKLGIAASISVRQIGRFLKGKRLTAS